MDIAKAVMQMKSMRMQKASENKEVHTPPSPIQRPLKRQTSWRSGLRGGMWRPTSEVLIPSKKEPVPRLRQAKHRQALTEVAIYHKAAMTIQQAWRSRPNRRVALLRLINSEARRRHLERRSFQTRAQLWEDMENSQEPGTSKGPSIWQMMQCSTILKEVLEDVLTATKTCQRLDAGVQAFMDGLKRKQAVRRKCQEIWRRIRPKLVAYSAMWNIIDTQRRTEMHWEALRQLIATPKASAQKSEVEAHWDKVLRLVGPAPECASEVEAVVTFAPLAPAICA